jgi:hypothetical protein
MNKKFSLKDLLFQENINKQYVSHIYARIYFKKCTYGSKKVILIPFLFFLYNKEYIFKDVPYQNLMFAAKKALLSFLIDCLTI